MKTFLKGRSNFDSNFCGRNYRGTYFCNLRPRSPKYISQNDQKTTSFEKLLRCSKKTYKVAILIAKLCSIKLLFIETLLANISLVSCKKMQFLLVVFEKIKLKAFTFLVFEEKYVSSNVSFPYLKKKAKTSVFIFSNTTHVNILKLPQMLFPMVIFKLTH